MKARTGVTVRSDGSLGALHCEPPLTLRRVAGGGRTALCLVGTAAGPLPGDDLELDLHLQPGARASLQATGAGIAQGCGERPARLTMRAILDDGADLIADPGPVIACAGSRVDLAVELTLASSATVAWRELVVLGRTADREPGAVTIRWDLTRAGRPVLRQLVDLTDASSRRWSTGGHRVLAGALISGPTNRARTLVRSPTAVVQAIDPSTALVTVLGDSAAEVTRELDGLLRATPGR